jgi:enolase
MVKEATQPKQEKRKGMETMNYYIKDDTSNTGRNYLDENGYNVALQENAQAFDTYDEAVEHCNYVHGEFALEEWASIVGED